MRQRVYDKLSALMIAFPLVFVLIFFGYFPVNFQIILHTDNIVGEGICQSYVCKLASFAEFYKIEFYFGSKLHKATLGDFKYDLDKLYLITSDVEKFDITSIDVVWNNITINHINPQDVISEDKELVGELASLTCKNNVLHVDVFDKNKGSTIEIYYDFLPKWFCISYFVVLTIIIIGASILINFILQKIPKLRLPLVYFSCIINTILSGAYFCGSIPYITYLNFCINTILIVGFVLIFSAISLPVISTILSSIILSIWYIANYFVIQYRGKPIMPSDLKVLGTAKEVMGNYSYMLDRRMVLGIIIIIINIIITVLIWNKYKTQNNYNFITRIKHRLAIIIFGISIILLSVNTNTFKSYSTFTWDMVVLKSFHEEGMVSTFIKNALNTQVKIPNGYTSDEVESYLADYNFENLSDEIHPTNIIMIMNEAFSDLRTVGLSSNIDVMPFIDSLDENTIEGSLYVSVFGGGTCNTEFEALTGNTLAFLGAGSYPYTDNITKPLFSLASYFRSLGYNTEAFHANQAQNWNRNIVYPNLGFEKFNSIQNYEEFGEISKLHDLPSDETDYKFIESVENLDEKPKFLFDVTIQNHSGYERWLDVIKNKSVEKYGNKLYTDTQIYLSLISASDNEIKTLIEKYKNCNEPTMIIFFGDHQPGLPQVAINEIYNDIKSNLDLYKSKFFIWTNYKSKALHNTGISANYLPWLILEQGNFPLPPYIQMLKEVYSKYPIISSQGVIDIDGNVYTSIAEVLDDPLIMRYQYIQYANLFDKISPTWFEVRK